jgi:predicted nucleotidyltransferase
MNVATEQKRKELLTYIEREAITAPSVQGVVVIGSVATGTARADSDIDPDIPVIRAMLHRAKSSGIYTVIVAGEPIYRDGRFTRIDKEAAVRELAESLQRPLTPGEEYRRKIAGDIYHHVEAFYGGYPGSDVRNPYYRRNSSV